MTVRKFEENSQRELFLSSQVCPVWAPSMSATSLRLALASRSSASRTAQSHYKKSHWSARHVHSRVPLPYSIEEGLGDFLPPNALKVVAIDYQDGLLQRLNEEVRGKFACCLPKV